MSIFLLGVTFLCASLLPGYALSLYFPFARGAMVRLGVALTSGMSLGVVAATVLAYARIPIVPWWVGILAAATVALCIPARDRVKEIGNEWREISRRDLTFLGVVCALSLGAAFLAFTPHYDYAWPIHADEWWGVGTVMNVLEGKGLDTHPYLFTDFANGKPGYTSYLTALIGSAGADPVAAWSVLPAANLFLAVFVGALALFMASGNAFVAGMLPIFVAALRSNAYTLGWWFLVPSMVGLLFLIPLLFSFSERTRVISAWWWRGLVFAGLALVYPPLAVIAAIPMAVMVLVGAHRKRLVGFLFFLVFVLGVAWGAAVSPYRTYWDFPGAPTVPAPLSGFIQAFFVPVEGTLHLVAYRDPLIVVGIPTLLFALLGLWFVRRTRWAWPLGLGALLMVANFALIMFADMSFALFHQRALYLLGVMAALLAPFGVWGIVQTLGRYAEGDTGGKWAWTVPLGLGLLAVMFFNYFEMRDGTKLYYPVARGDVATMEQLKAPAFEGMTVVADPFPGTVVPQFTRLASKVSLLTDQSLTRFTASGVTMSLSAGDCVAKREFLVRMDADLVYTRFPQSCPFLREIYRAEGIFIYMTEKGATKRSKVDVDN